MGFFTWVDWGQYVHTTRSFTTRYDMCSITFMLIKSCKEVVARQILPILESHVISWIVKSGGSVDYGKRRRFSIYMWGGLVRTDRAISPHPRLFFNSGQRIVSYLAPSNGVILPSSMTLAPLLPSLTSCPTAAKQETLTNSHTLPHQPLANGHSDTSPPQNPIVGGDNSPLRELCTRLNAQITTFLHEDVKTERLKATQAQTRISLKIIQEALDRYPQVLHFHAPPAVIHSLCVSTLLTLYALHQAVLHLPLL